MGSQPREGDEDQHGPQDDSFTLEVTSLDTGQRGLRNPRPRWLRYAQILTVLLVIVVPLAVLAFPRLPHTVSLPDGHTPPTVLSLGGAHSPFACPANSAWSHDSKHIALVGYRTCASFAPVFTQNSRGTLALYDASLTTAPYLVLDLDSLVTAEGVPPGVKNNPETMSELTFDYQQMDWSPDDKTIAIWYGGVLTQDTAGGSGLSTQDSRVNGLILVPTSKSGGKPRVLAQPDPQLTFPNDPLAPRPVEEWNLATGTLQVVMVPPALAYRWDANDTLFPTLALNPPGAKPPHVPVAPIGNPIGGKSFTLWQAGELSMQWDCSASRVFEGYPLFLETSNNVWSPDGKRVLLGGLRTYGVLDASVPNSTTTHVDASSCSRQTGPAPSLPVRDAGLRAALAAQTANESTHLTWSADGKRLLSIQTPLGSGGPARTYQVRVYDCLSGSVLSTFTLSQPISLSFLPIDLSTDWSPDNQHLLVLDPGVGKVILYDDSWLGG